MIFPNLVLDTFCNCYIDVIINEEGLSEDGGPIEHRFNNIKCNYQSKAKTILDSDKKIVEVIASCYIPGDPFQGIEILSGGTVILDGVERRIEQGSKNRNPDNTVNFVLLELK